MFRRKELEVVKMNCMARTIGSYVQPVIAAILFRKEQTAEVRINKKIVNANPSITHEKRYLRN